MIINFIRPSSYNNMHYTRIDLGTLEIIINAEIELLKSTVELQHLLKAGPFPHQRVGCLACAGIFASPE